MELEAKRWIIFDGNCGLCLKSKKLLTQLGVFPDSRCLNYHELDATLKSKVDSKRFSFEMALVDESNDNTLYGLEGILSIFSEKVSWLKLIKSGSFAFVFLQFFYHTISYNRYFLFPRKKVFICDCDPPFVPRFYKQWIGLGTFFSVLISFLLGYVLAGLIGLPAIDLGFKMLVIVGLGWIIQALLAKVVMRKREFQDYSRHLALIGLVGVLILLPVLVFSPIFPVPLSRYFLAFCVLLSSAIMSYMHFKRISFMNLSQLWTLSWFVWLQLCAWSLSFYFELLPL